MSLCSGWATVLPTGTACAASSGKGLQFGVLESENITPKPQTGGLTPTKSPEEDLQRQV